MTDIELLRCANEFGIKFDQKTAYRIADTLEALHAGNVALKAERDALAKSLSTVSAPIETIQPRGITE